MSGRVRLSPAVDNWLWQIVGGQIGLGARRAAAVDLRRPAPVMPPASATVLPLVGVVQHNRPQAVGIIR